MLWDSTIQLGEQFFNEIIAHPVPIDLHVLKAVKRSPLGLDLYLWLTYRTFTLKAPLRLSWKQLYRQFGAGPPLASCGMPRAACQCRTWTLYDRRRIREFCSVCAGRDQTARGTYRGG